MSKKISILIPCYNEQKSVEEMYMRLRAVLDNDLKQYDYEIIYVDDYSTDNTRNEIKKICEKDKMVKAVFNAKNFGFHRNVFEAFKYASGDCAFMIFGDLQDPPEMLPQFIDKWEQGYKCVIGQKNTSKESWIMQRFRRLYYWLVNKLGDKEQIQFANGFGVYDHSFIEVLSEIDETSPYFKSIISEYGMNIAIVKYNHSESRRGKSNFNFLKNYDFAMHGITSSTKLLMRLSTFCGLFVGILCLFFAIYVCIKKIIFWDSYPLGTASIIVGVFFLGSMQLFFIGILGEYILSINERVSHKPRVIVAEKINFDGSER